MVDLGKEYLSAVIDISSNDKISSSIETMPEKFIVGLEIPTLTSTDLFIQGSLDGKTFRRALKADGSGDWLISATTGDRLIFLDEMAAFPYLRIECGTSQAADRTFNFIMRNK